MEFYIDSIAILDSIPRLMCQYGSYEDDAVFLVSYKFMYRRVLSRVTNPDLQQYIDYIISITNLDLLPTTGIFRK